LGIEGHGCQCGKCWVYLPLLNDKGNWNLMSKQRIILDEATNTRPKWVSNMPTYMSNRFWFLQKSSKIAKRNIFWPDFSMKIMQKLLFLILSKNLPSISCAKYLILKKFELLIRLSNNIQLQIWRKSGDFET
jgi:hypothetical protein